MLAGNGIGLSQRFYTDIVALIMTRYFPDEPYAAARIGLGSEVQGYDTELSTDHDFGPCIQLFLNDSVFPEKARKIMDVLDAALPASFEGFATRYSAVTRPPGRTQPREGMLGSVHGVELYTLSAWSARFLQRQFSSPLTPLEWLSYPEQLYLITTKGAVFRDDSGELTALRRRLDWFPNDVWLYKLASQWGKIAAESTYPGRTGSVGDELGSQVIAARMVENIMRLAMLIERHYAPYPKWLGTAFSHLKCAPELAPRLEACLQAQHWQERENGLIAACEHVAQLQLSLRVPGAIPPAITTRRNRPFRFINSLEISQAIQSAIEDKDLRERLDVGGVDQFISSHVILSVPALSRAVAEGWFGADPASC